MNLTCRIRWLICPSVSAIKTATSISMNVAKPISHDGTPDSRIMCSDDVDCVLVDIRGGIRSIKHPIASTTIGTLHRLGSVLTEPTSCVRALPITASTFLPADLNELTVVDLLVGLSSNRLRVGCCGFVSALRTRTSLFISPDNSMEILSA